MPEATTLDLLIRGGTVFDGTGAPGVRADVGVRGDRVVQVGDLGSARAGRVLDARGRYVTPGFIDIHGHSDLAMLMNPRLESKVRQGVTTEVVGNCGSSAAPLAGDAIAPLAKAVGRLGHMLTWRGVGEYLDRVEAIGCGINLVTLVGHGTLRESVMGYAMRPPTAGELCQMRARLGQALAEGAVGLASGLIYPPSSYADTDELVELGREVAAAGGLYASHLRDEADHLLDSVAEAIAVGERGGARVQISHHKAAGRPNWGRVRDSLALMAAARARGVDVACDQYPYVAASTGLNALLPAWAFEGGESTLLNRLRDPQTRARLRAALIQPGADSFMRHLAWHDILIAACGQPRAYEGQRLDMVAAALGQHPADLALDLLAANEAHVGCVFFSMSEDDVQTILRDPHTVIGSDSAARAPYGRAATGKPHPRTYGTFPRVLARYVRELKLLDWPMAVARMTGQTTARLGLIDRGVLRPGTYADLVVLDPATVADRATYADPHQYPTGIETVVVNGRVAIANGEHSGALAGRALRHPYPSHREVAG